MQNVTLRNALGAFACVALLAMLGCNNGTPLPPGVSVGGDAPAQAAGELEPLMINVAGFVGGESAAAAAPSQTKSNQPKANSVSGVIAGANGLDLKDAAWNNLFSSGVSTQTFPASVTPVIRFKSAGSEEALGSVNVASNGLFDTAFDARTLRTGTNLILEMTIGSEISEIMLPVLTVDDGDRVGFNAIRRIDGSLVAELFVDGVNNETGAALPDGLADNGLRVVVDNGFDIDGDGNADTIARMDSLDGMSIFDLNLDGRFGDPNDDALTYIDLDSDGFPETPFHMATESQQDSLPNPSSFASIIDPELDGFAASDAERALVNGSPSNFIASAEFAAAPTTLQANGVNTATLGLALWPTRQGLPLGTALTFTLARHGGMLIAGADTGEARFINNEASAITRVIETSDPAVRLFFNGKIILTESFLAPLLDVDSVNAETHLMANVIYAGRATQGENALSSEARVDLEPSMAPLLSEVAFTAQNSIAGVMGGLENASRHGVVVWGDTVQITGLNFATTSENNIVNIGGLPADNVVVNSEGTEITCNVPVGAQTGPISVVVAGFGGKTSKNLVIAGEPFVASTISPMGSSHPTNVEFSITMSRPVDATTIANSIFVEDSSGVDQNWEASLEADGKTIKIIRGAGSALVEASSYNVVFTSDLAATDATPTMHFDPMPGMAVGGTPERRSVITFAAVAEDTTAPTVMNTVPAEGSQEIDTRTSLVVNFSEAMSTASIASAIDANALELLDTDNNMPIAFSWSQSADLTGLTITPTQPLAGNTNFTLSVPANFNALEDAAGNELFVPVPGAPVDFTLSFTTSLGILDIEPRSGPVGTEVLVTGGDFSGPSVSATIGGISAPISVINATSATVTVPSGSEGFFGGDLIVSVDDSTGTSPVPFTVTLDLQTVDLPGVEGARPIGLALSRNDETLFVANQGNGSVAAFNLDTRTRLDTDGDQSNGVNDLQVGRVPTEALLSRDGRYLLTLDYGTPDSEGDSFYVVSLDSPENGIGVSSPVRVGKRPTRIATSPDGSLWYVTNNKSNTVSVISAEPPFVVVAQIPTGEGPNGVTISADGRRGYVCNFFAGTLTVFDTASNESIGEVPVGAGPARAILSPSGKHVIVSCNADNSLHVVDAINTRNLFSIPTLPEPSAMAFSRDGTSLFVTSRRNDVITRYTFSSSLSGSPMLSQDALIQTGRTPSGLVVTGDGSRLVVSAEGSGMAQVIFLEVPTHVITEVRRENMQPTSTADAGEVVVIEGERFGTDFSNVRVHFNGSSEAVIDEAQSSSTSLKVRVPDDATSGPLTVVIGDKESSPLSFVISPRIPRLTATTPSNGSLNVAEDAKISFRFNEPVLVTASDIVVERLEDTFTNGVRDVNPQPISGSVQTRNFGREVVFTPDAPMTSTSGSNNLVRVTLMTSMRDFVGNHLNRPESFTFRLMDDRGPTLLRATYIDVDNNGVDVGDVVNLTFDEEVGSAQLPATIGSNSSAVSFSDSSGFGVGATFELPNLNLLERTSPPNELDDLSRTIMVRLGQGANLLVPGMRTAITGLTNFDNQSAIVDAAGNSDLALATPSIDLGIALASQGTPEALSIVLLDDDGNMIAEEGEVMAIYANQPLTLVGAVTEADFILSGSGASLGTNPTFALDPSNARVLRITLGAGAMFDFSDTPNFSLSAPNGLPNAVSFLDQPLQAWSSIVYSIGESTVGPQIDTNSGAVVFRDVDSNGPDVGDVIEVRFDAELTVGAAPAAICFDLPVVGDSFGNGAFIRPSQNLDLTQQERARTVDIVLGPNAKLRPAGMFAAGATGFGNASGLDVLSTIPQWAVADVFGNSVRPNENGASDLGSDDMDAPQLFDAVYRDNNTNQLIDGGDAIIIVFDETLVRNGVSAADFSVEIQSSQVFNLGLNPTLSFGPNKPVNETVVQNNSLRLTLGEGTNLTAQSGVDVVINAGNPITDVSGNLVASGDRIPLDLNLPETPEPILALANDEDSSGDVSAGDRIWVKFNRGVNLGASSPQLAFDLINPSADFGSGASMSIAVVDSALRATGMTGFPIGESDPQIVEIILGSSPILPDIEGNAPRFIFDYNSGMPVGNFTSATPVGIAMLPVNGAVLPISQLVGLFDDATRMGSPAVFDTNTLTLNGMANSQPVTDNIVFDLQLPGNVRSMAPTAAHAKAVVSALNDVFVRESWNYRAFASPAGGGAIVVTPNNPFWSISSFDISGIDTLTGFADLAFSGGSIDAVTSSGVPAIAARGSVDLTGSFMAPAPTGPTLSAALYNDSDTELELFFDQQIQINTSHAVDTVFELPVADDTFGSGATWEAGSTAFSLSITLGSGFVFNSDGTFDSGDTIAGAASGIRVSLSAPSDAIRNAGNLSANTNFVDIGGDSTSPVGPAPQMVSAVMDPTMTEIVVTFDQNVFYDPSTMLSNVFELPVDDDAFGFGGERLVTSVNPNEVTILLGSGFVLNPAGTFDPQETFDGASSGIAISSIITATDLANGEGTAPALGVVDLEFTAPPTPTLVLSAFSTGVGNIELGSGMHAVMGIELSTSEQTPISLDTLVFDLSSSALSGLGFDLYSIAEGWFLYLDDNANGTFDQFDVEVASGDEFNGEVHVFPTISPISDSSTTRVFLVLDAGLNPSLTGGGFQVRCLSALASDLNSTPAQASGLPLVSPVMQYFDNPSLPSGTRIGQTFQVDDPLTATDSLWGRAAVSTDDLNNFDRASYVSQAALQSATITDIAGQMLTVSVADSALPPFNILLPASPSLTSADDKAIAIAKAINEEINQSSLAGEMRCLVDNKGSIVLLGYTFETGLDFQVGGAMDTDLTGTDVEYQRHHVWGEQQYGILFGGKNSSTVSNKLTIYREDLESQRVMEMSVPIINDPIEGAPAARYDAAMTISDFGVIYLNGGRNNSTIFADTWSLTPVFGPEILGYAPNGGEPKELKALRWRQLTTGTGVPRHSHTLSFVGSSLATEAASLVAVGGVSTGNTVLSSVDVYDLRSESWNTLSPVGGSIQGLAGHSSAYVPEAGVLLVVGGATVANGTSQSSEVHALLLPDDGVYVKNSYTPSGDMPESSFRKASIFEDDELQLITVGGQLEDGSVSDQVSILQIDDGLVSAQWISISVEDALIADIARADANLVSFDSHAVLAYGRSDATTAIDSIIPIDIGGFSGDSESDTLILGALLKPIGTGTSGVDAGETITIFFGGPTNLLEIFPAATMDDLSLAEYIEIAGGSVPSGSSAEISSGIYEADTLTITLGSGLSFTESLEVSFAGSRFAQQPLVSDEQLIEGVIEVFGSADHTNFYEWKGITTDFNNPNNWMPNAVPSTGDCIYIPQGSVPCIADPDFGSSPPPVELAQIFVYRNSLTITPDLELHGGSAINSEFPALTVIHGSARFADVDFDGNGNWVSIAAIGDVSVGNITLSDGTSSGETTLFSYGTIEVRGNMDLSIGAEEGELKRYYGPNDSTLFLRFTSSSTQDHIASIDASRLEVRGSNVSFTGEKFAVNNLVSRASLLTLDTGFGATFLESVHVFNNGTLASGASSAPFVFGLGCNDIRVPNLLASTGSDPIFDGYVSDISNGFELGPGSVTLTGSATIESGEGRDGSGNAVEMQNGGTLEVLSHELSGLRYAALRFSVKADDPSIFVEASIRSFNGGDIIHELFTAGDSAGDFKPGVWRDVTMPFVVPEDQMVDIVIECNQFGGTIHFDDLEIVSLYRFTNTGSAPALSFSTGSNTVFNNVCLDFRANPSTVLIDTDLGSAVSPSTSGSTILIGEDSVLTLNSPSIPQRMAIEVDALSGDSSTISWNTASANGDLSGTLFGRNVDFISNSTNRIIDLELGSALSIEHATVTNTQFNVADSVSSVSERAAGIYLNNVQFMGMPGESLSSPSMLAYVVMNESGDQVGDYERFAMIDISQRPLDTVFISVGSSTLFSPFTVNAVSETFTADFEDDPSSSAGFEDSTGNVQWNPEEAATVEFVDAFSSPINGAAVSLTPGTNNSVLVGLLVTPLGASYTLSDMNLQISSNVDDGVTPAFNGVTLAIDDGDGNYNSGTDTVFGSGSFSPEDEPSFFASGSLQIINSPTVVWVLADVLSSAPAGAELNLGVFLTDGVVTYPDSEYSEFPPSLDLRVGPADAPTVNEVRISNSMSGSYFPGDSLTIEGANLHLATTIRVDFIDDSQNLTPSMQTPVASADGRYVSGITFENAPNSDVFILVTIDEGMASEAVFRINTEFSFNP